MSISKQNKKVVFITGIVFAACLTGYSVLMYRLFYQQAVHCATREVYFSDIKAYLETILGLECDYDFPYPVYFWLGRFFLRFTNVAVAASLAASLLNSLGVAILFYYMLKSLQKHYGRTAYREYTGLFTVFLTFGMFFVSMLYLPGGILLPGITNRYLGVFTPNPYHNITYMATRPFAILAFFLFARILDYYEERTDLKEFFLFGVSLLLTTMTKPSYTLILVSTAGLVMLYRLFRGRWKNLKRSVYLGLAFVPTFIDMLYQFGGVFGESSKAGESGGIGIGIGSVWKLYTDNIPLAVVLALGFPLLVLLFHGKEIKQNTLYRFSWVQLIVSIMELFLLYENGRRFSDANFSWGYMHGIFFVFVTSLILLAEDTMEKRGKSRVLWMQWLLYGLHLVCGIGYFIYIWGGNAFHEF